MLLRAADDLQKTFWFIYVTQVQTLSNLLNKAIALPTD